MQVKDIAERMMRKGIDIPTISEVLDVDALDLEEFRSTLDIVINREDVVEAMNRLAWSAYEKGLRILNEGTPNSQMALIRMMLSNMRGMMGQQSPKVMAELIAQFKDTIEMHEEVDEDDDDVAEDIGEDVG